MVILAIVSTVLSGVVWAAVRAYDEGAESARLHTEASIAMERMVRDLRAVPLNAGGEPDIASISPEAITWDNASRSLALVGSDLVLTIDGEEGVLLSDVTGFALRGFDASNNPMASSLSGAATGPVRRLTIALTTARGRASSAVRTKVFLRCMMLEDMQ
jgi:Tfp pilus assembly protein PilW